MLPYEAIARLLNSVSLETKRSSKADLISSCLRALPHDEVPIAVRLLQGELWPAWSGSELGVGRSTVLRALGSISGSNSLEIMLLHHGELGGLAEEALEKRSQSSISDQPLDISDVLFGLVKVSNQIGDRSMYRKEAILRGLLIRSTPLEARYIVRTVTRSLQAGIGPRVMAASLALAFNDAESEIWRAYSVLPDMALVASAACDRVLGSVAVRPGTPLKSMQLRVGRPDAIDGYICVKGYKGLRVQVHWHKGTYRIFTSRLRDISSALTGLSNDLSLGDRDYVVEAELLGYKNKFLPQSQLVRFINRRQNARKSSMRPLFVVHDLLYLDSNDKSSLPYVKRRQILVDLLTCKTFSGGDEHMVSLDEAVPCANIPTSLDSGLEFYIRCASLPYTPGVQSRYDRFMKGRSPLLNVVITEGVLSKDDPVFKVALRDGDELVSIGLVNAGVFFDDICNELKDSVLSRDGDRVVFRPSLVIRIGLDKVSLEHELIRPRIDSVVFEASLDDVDSISLLDTISKESISKE